MSMACLDRFLVSQDWVDHFGSATQSKLPKPILDHLPLLLECGGIRRSRHLLISRICGLKSRDLRTL